MKEEDLLKVKLPSSSIKVTHGKLKFEASVRFQLATEKGPWYLVGQLNPTTFQRVQDRVLLNIEDITDILNDDLSCDQFFQDKPFQESRTVLTAKLCSLVASQQPGKCSASDTPKIQISQEPYLVQKHAQPGNRQTENLLCILGETVKQETAKKQICSIPSYLQAETPLHYHPDKAILESFLQHIYDGVPAIGIFGPTGSGKSTLARHVAGYLNAFGWATHVIDANARLEGDRLFERDDFDSEGTFVQEGVLLRLARETQKMGLRLLVILDEYNAFSDETRREFYRVFSDENRLFPIQSGKTGKIEDYVDFSHVQFILTGNPLSSDRYMTDDLKRLSNAEVRRLVILHLGYERDPEKLKNIFASIIQKKFSYMKLARVVPDLDKRINYQLGVELFTALNPPEGSIGFDFGYSAVANCIWSMCLRAHNPNGMVSSIMEHILGGIQELSVRSVASDKIQQAVNITLPKELLIQDQ